MAAVHNQPHPLALLRIDTPYVERIEDMGPIAGDPPQLIVRADQSLVARVNGYAVHLHAAAEKDRESFNKELTPKMRAYAIEWGAKGFSYGFTIANIFLFFNTASLSWLAKASYMTAGGIGGGAVGAGGGAGCAYYRHEQNQTALIDACRDICMKEFLALSMLLINLHDEERNLKNVSPLTAEQKNQLVWIQKFHKLIQTLTDDLNVSIDAGFDKHSIKHLPLNLQQAYK